MYTVSQVKKQNKQKNTTEFTKKHNKTKLISKTRDNISLLQCY